MICGVAVGKRGGAAVGVNPPVTAKKFGLNYGRSFFAVLFCKPAKYRLRVIQLQAAQDPPRGLGPDGRPSKS